VAIVPPGVFSTSLSDALGVRGGELDRDPPAERLAVQVRVVDPQRVQQRGEVGDVVSELQVDGGLLV
jgi:hypothetical protein